MKKPEEYLEENVVAPDEKPGASQLNSMEQEFIKKYLTGEQGPDLNAQEPTTAFSFGEKTATESPPEREQEIVESEPERDREQKPSPNKEKENLQGEEEQEEKSKVQEEQEISSRDTIQLVGFYLQNQEYTIPISDVKEVIKRVEPTELPETPEYLLGVVNLKGKITPLVNLAYLLGKSDFDSSQCGFIIVGYYQDLQIGVMVDRITTMHNIEQKDIDWTLDPYLTGGGKEFLSGLIRGEHLIGIISIKEIVDKIMQ